MTNFMVGDIVIGNVKATRYYYTTVNTKWLVVKVKDNENINLVKPEDYLSYLQAVKQGNNEDHASFVVRAYCFDLFDRPPTDNKKGKLSLIKFTEE